MNQNFNLFRQEHYVAPALESLVVDVTGAICQGSPYGEIGEAGDSFTEENTNDYVENLL